MTVPPNTARSLILSDVWEMRLEENRGDVLTMPSPQTVDTIRWDGPLFDPIAVKGYLNGIQWQVGDKVSFTADITAVLAVEPIVFECLNSDLCTKQFPYTLVKENFV